MSVIVTEFVTIDGVVGDPDGSDGTAAGGWAFRHGPEAVAGDKFKLGSKLETGTLLFGRNTWQLFSRIWPGRSGGFADTLNQARKLVVSRTLADTDAWQNSSLLKGDLVAEAGRLREETDLIVIGSIEVAQTLAAHDLVDEYRLLVFPTAVGGGRRLFDGLPPADLQVTSVERVGAAVLTCYRTR